MKNWQTLSIWKDEIGKEEYMPTDEVNCYSKIIFFAKIMQLTTFPLMIYNEQVQVPIILTLCTMGAYIVLGALVFAYIEDWKLSDAIYFSFVTLTTIGFGDFVPHPRYGQEFYDKRKMKESKLFQNLEIC